MSATAVLPVNAPWQLAGKTKAAAVAAAKAVLISILVEALMQQMIYCWGNREVRGDIRRCGGVVRRSGTTHGDWKKGFIPSGLW
jgi:hypothetical protein